MKLLTTSVGSYLTGTAIADAVLRYGLTLAKRRDVDIVDIPYLGEDGEVRRARFTIGWRYDIQATTQPTFGAELVEAGTAFALEGKAGSLAAVRAGEFSSEEAAEITWPEDKEFGL